MLGNHVLGRNFAARWAAAWAVAILGAAVVLAQESAWDKSAEIVFPDVWIGSHPIKVEDLKGKAAILYFFEESCPKCKASWPGIQALASKYADKPIAFVAVNSGTPAPLVAQYANSVGLSWPVIVDVDRSFEKACAVVGEISLKNVAQVAYLTPDGKLLPGRFTKLDDTIEQALKGASWDIDPAEIPQELWTAWRGIEFAQYAPAAVALAKARTSRKGEVKAAAEKLANLVDNKGAEALAAAKSEAQKSKVRAHNQYAAITARFAGYKAATEAATAVREIAKDPAYRQELSAIKQIEKQRPLANSPKSAVRERAAVTIKKIIGEYPDSEAARLGHAILENQAIFQQ